MIGVNPGVDCGMPKIFINAPIPPTIGWARSINLILTIAGGEYLHQYEAISQISTGGITYGTAIYNITTFNFGTGAPTQITTISPAHPWIEGCLSSNSTIHIGVLDVGQYHFIFYVEGTYTEIVEGFRMELLGVPVKCCIYNKCTKTVTTADTGKIFNGSFEAWPPMLFSYPAGWSVSQYYVLTFPNGTYDIVDSTATNYNCGLPTNISTAVLNSRHILQGNKICNYNGDAIYTLPGTKHNKIIGGDDTSTIVISTNNDNKLYGVHILNETIHTITGFNGKTYRVLPAAEIGIGLNTIATRCFYMYEKPFAVLPIYGSIPQAYIYNLTTHAIVSDALSFPSTYYYGKNKIFRGFKSPFGLIGGCVDNHNDAVILSGYTATEAHAGGGSFPFNFPAGCDFRGALPMILYHKFDGMFKQDTGYDTAFDSSAPYAEKLFTKFQSAQEEAEFQSNSSVLRRVPAYYGLKGRVHLNYIKTGNYSIVASSFNEKTITNFETYIAQCAFAINDSGIYLHEITGQPRASYYRHFLNISVKWFSAQMFNNPMADPYNNALVANFGAITVPNIWRYNEFYNSYFQLLRPISSTKNILDFRHYYYNGKIYDMWYNKLYKYANKSGTSIDDLLDTDITPNGIDSGTISIKKIISTPENCMVIFDKFEHFVGVGTVLYSTVYKIDMNDSNNGFEKTIIATVDRASPKPYSIYDVVYNPKYNYFIADQINTYLPNLDTTKPVTKKFGKMYDTEETFIYWNKKYTIKT